MKTTSLLLLLALPAALLAQVTFPVCEVEPAEEALNEVPYHDVITYLAERDKHNSGTGQDAPEPRLDAYGRQPYPLVPTHGNHPFVVSAHQAYAQHRPLAISPDMIWLLLLQGFAAHVDANGEALRHHFVQHEGRQVLYVQRDDYVRGDSLFPWPEVFSEFRDQIEAYTSKEVVPLVSAQFSTTGPTERAAFEVTLMDAMSTYFLFVMGITCGIPEITLEGTPEDWAELERRAGQLGRYELSWWTDELQPILREFTLASRGQANQDFWRDFFLYETPDIGCGAVGYVTGWITLFFPYYHEQPNPWITERKAVDDFYAALNEAVGLRNDPKVQRKMKKTARKRNARQKWAAVREKMRPRPQAFGLPAIEIAQLPMGLSSADLLVDYNGLRLDYKLQAGFVGIRQDAQTLALRPEINWLVVDTGKEPSAEDEALYDKWLEEQKRAAGR